MIAKVITQMRPCGQGSQLGTEEHNYSIGASINARTKEILERRPTAVVFGTLLLDLPSESEGENLGHFI